MHLREKIFVFNIWYFKDHMRVGYIWVMNTMVVVLKRQLFFKKLLWIVKSDLSFLSVLWLLKPSVMKLLENIKIIQLQKVRSKFIRQLSDMQMVTAFCTAISFYQSRAHIKSRKFIKKLNNISEFTATRNL